MSDFTVTRFPNGISDSAEDSWGGDLAAINPTRYFGFADDFAGPTTFPIAASALAAASNSTWTLTVTEAGAGDASSAIANANGGVLTLTTDAADNDAIFAQRKGESFLLTAGKKTFFKTRFKLTDATANAASILESEFYFGLMVTDTDPLSSTAGDGVTDGIFFMKEDGTQNVNFYVQKNATTGQLTSSAVTTITVNTYVTLGFAFDGARYVRLFKDDAYLTTIDLTETLTTYLPDSTLTVSFGIKNGEAVAKVLSLDYIVAMQER